MEKTNRAMALHYFWKKVCEGWHLVERDDLSVIAEKMPPRTAEDMHYHQKAQQFFYVLSGQAAMRFSESLHSAYGSLGSAHIYGRAKYPTKP